MIKTSIKIIKRKDAEVSAAAKSQITRELKQTASSSKEKNERTSQREIVGKILNWISERRENNRIEENAATGEFLAWKLCSTTDSDKC